MTAQINAKSVLFQPTTEYGNVAINFRGLPQEEFNLYARAFHSGAKALTQKMLDPQSYNDLDACPIIFLYRHSLELYLKAVVLIGSKILDLSNRAIASQRKENLFKSHKLSPLLPEIEKIFHEVDWQWNLNIDGLRTFDELKTLLADFDSIDPNSSAFRYPINTQGTGSVPKHFMMNIPLFCDRMDQLLGLLEGAVMGLRQIWDERVKVEYDAQIS